MLSKYQFEFCARSLYRAINPARNRIWGRGILGSVNKARKSLKDLGFLDGEGRVTPLGEKRPFFVSRRQRGNSRCRFGEPSCPVVV